jgi:hypothetical protein
MTRSVERRSLLRGIAAIPVLTGGATILGWPGGGDNEPVDASSALRTTAGSTASPAPQAKPRATRRPRQFGFFSDPNPATIVQIAGTGVGGVSMGPYFRMTTSIDPTCGPVVNGGPATIMAQMDYARRLGLHVTLKPMVDALAYPRRGEWRANIDPSDPSAWFEDYFERGIRPYLPHADSLIVYTETTTLSAKYPTLWVLLVAKVRAAGFHGPISSDSDLSTTTTPWYPTLDWFGGSFYPAIDTSTDGTARRDWSAIATQVTQAHQNTSLPIFMAEVGVFGLDDARLIRWVSAMFEVLGPLPFWAGFSWWRWSQDPAEAMSGTCQAAFRSLATAWA